MTLAGMAVPATGPGGRPTVGDSGGAGVSCPPAAIAGLDGGTGGVLAEVDDPAAAGGGVLVGAGPPAEAVTDAGDGVLLGAGPLAEEAAGAGGGVLVGAGPPAEEAVGGAAAGWICIHC